LDTLQRLRADEVFPGYRPGLARDDASFTVHGLTPEDYRKLGDRVVLDARTRSLRPITRAQVGDRLDAAGLDPALEHRGPVRLVDGTTVEVATAFSMYRIHLQDYDLDTVLEITGAPRDLVERLIDDLATIRPAAIHIGEGVNHYFHATLHNRAVYLVMMLTGNIGVPGSGVSTWAGNYKGAIFHGAPWHGPGVGGYVFEDPFRPLERPGDRYTEATTRAAAHGEETSYWGFGDRPLIVDTPGAGRKVFTGSTHMPTPTKVLWYNNANLINQAKWAYELVRSTNPKIDLIIDQQIEWTGSAEFADVMLPANSWMEMETLEMGGSPSNPFLQVWKGGIEPLHDTRDDVAIFAGVAGALTDLTDEARFATCFRFASEGRPEVYLDRVLEASITTAGYTVDGIMSGRYGEPGGALMQYRTYPRIPFWEQVHDDLPFYTDTGRLNAYCDLPEAIEYGENMIVHREAVEATPYLPNVIVSRSPFVRPESYGIAPEEMDADLRSVRNLKMSWAEVKGTRNPLHEQGFRFYCLTPKSRHTVHSSWAVTDWNVLWASNFADPFRTDRQLPGVGEPQLHMNPQAAKDLGIDNGDRVWVDANPADRPFRGWRDDPTFYGVARLMVRVTYNPAYPYDVTMLKHAMWMSTPRTVRATEERADGRALAEGTGYQSNFRSGSQQSLTRAWAPPMHQTDSLFHKRGATMGFVFGFDEDNHAVNTTPKETLVRVTKADDRPVPWERLGTAMTPGQEGDVMERYLAGTLADVRRR
ncbi:MAG TPA: molybdopterin-dependent oxidoreductase, partial [Actinomycetota bacterium]|nr:molybdopterin-dependent oxidoreductase [Actinomycetota bacterium]